MSHSSLGFHTITMSLLIDSEKATTALVKDFMRYNRETDSLKVYAYRYDYTFINYKPRNDTSCNYKYFKFYYRDYNGITWSLLPYWDYHTDDYYVYAKINPKFLAGINDYTTAATYKDMEKAIITFNQEAAKISPRLQEFKFYKITRIDYCVNLCIDELVKTEGCSSQKIMELIKRSDIPYPYKEWTEYDKISHRTKSRNNSFYLINDSVHINCYDKYSELIERSHENELRGNPPMPQETLNCAKNIIRFEVQCMPHKISKLSKTAEQIGNTCINKYKTLLSPEVCQQIVSYYYNWIIGSSTWYTLPNAINKVKAVNFNQQKERRLIEALKLVNQCRSISKAKEACSDEELKVFKQSLKDLSLICVNPVTIPTNWNIKSIKSPFGQYQSEVYQKQLNDGYIKGRPKIMFV